MKTKFVCRNASCGKQCECATEGVPMFCLFVHSDCAREKYHFQEEDWRVKSESPTIEPEPVPEQDENHIVVDDIKYEAVDDIKYEAVEGDTCDGCVFVFGSKACRMVACGPEARRDGRSVIWKRVEKAKEPPRIALNVENGW